MVLQNRLVRPIALAMLVALPCVAYSAEPASKSKEAAKRPDMSQVQRGRYIVRISGCNDCHTPGYAQTAGQVPEKQWLVGDVLGWRGPWGTTYPVNLRLYMQTLSEDEWVKIAHSREMRPPMPWFALRDMTERDVRAIYRFIKYLGPAGEAAPAYIPPDKEPKPPYVQFPQPPK
jgi:mono/diheme cytochrome c family protein